ncbi:hypothetical protein, partial [Mycobacterium kansasii]|uniref:hypothetical protein n=1 Tax=Mycobacterium kansasii TaxID=1768 RepID=UPI001E3CDBD0
MSAPTTVAAVAMLRLPSAPAATPLLALPTTVGNRLIPIKNRGRRRHHIDTAIRIRRNSTIAITDHRRNSTIAITDHRGRRGHIDTTIRTSRHPTIGITNHRRRRGHIDTTIRTSRHPTIGITNHRRRRTNIGLP